jgi:hypothetical protein
VKHIGLFERNGHGSERLPTLLVKVVGHDRREGLLDAPHVGAERLVVGRTESDGELVRRDRRVALVLDVTGGLLLKGDGDLVGMYGAAEEPRERVADGALDPPLEALDDAHVTSCRCSFVFVLSGVRCRVVVAMARRHCPGSVWTPPPLRGSGDTPPVLAMFPIEGWAMGSGSLPAGG